MTLEQTPSRVSSFEMILIIQIGIKKDFKLPIDFWSNNFWGFPPRIEIPYAFTQAFLVNYEAFLLTLD